MKTLKKSISYWLMATVIITALSACERDTDGLLPAEYPVNYDVFIDGFSGGLEYAAFGGSNVAAFDVDYETTYNGSAASMRFEVPDVGDPRGTYAGGVFYSAGPRNLSGATALTFWAKASKAANLDIVGFGNDLGENRYQVSVANLPINTSWQRYIIPIPDPSRLTAERGMFFYSEGAENDKGYTFWIDEVRFEDLGTIAHGEHNILFGNDEVITSFAGVSLSVSGLSSTFNLPNGLNTTVNLTPAYFDFYSSNPSIATANADAEIEILDGPGTAVIKGIMNGDTANGSLTIQSSGVYTNAPTPTRPAANVISLFSDAYPNAPVEYYNGYWAPFQTTTSEDFTINGDNVLHYLNFNFVGIQFSQPTINLSSKTHLHIDLYILNALGPAAQFKIQLVDFGPDGAFDGGDDSNHTLTFTAPILAEKKWISLELPLSNFTGLTSRAAVAQIIFEGTGVNSFYADNIYFYN